MKNDKSILAILAGVIAVAVLFRSKVNADSLIGFGAVAVLLGFMALEYRVSWKSLFGR